MRALTSRPDVFIRRTVAADATRRRYPSAMAIHADTHDDLRLFQTGEHACGYWSGRQARDLVLDPHDPRLGRSIRKRWHGASVAPAIWSTGRTANGAVPVCRYASRWMRFTPTAANAVAWRVTGIWWCAW